MSNYSRFLAMLSTEFHRYLMEHEQIGEKIPPNAMIVFQVDGDDAFNRWHKDMSLRNREKDQPMILIRVESWREHSSIAELHLTQVGEEPELSSGAAGSE
ncbi:MAG: DUF5647 family protein [Deltaproteobacteria bacterium]|nr:DUF5647 family protein [Deltaproteobacteria bacterium]